MRIFAALFVLSVLLAACDSEGGQGDGRVDAGSSSTPPIGEQIPGGMGFDLGFSARADRDDAVDQPWRVPCVEGPLAADSNRSAARGLTQRGTRQTAMMWTSRTFVVYPNASVARQAVRQLTTVLLSCPSAPKRWRMDMASVGDETRRFLGRVTLAKPERDAWGDPVRKESVVVLVTRTGRTVLATSSAVDALDAASVIDLGPSLPLFVHHPAAVAQLCSYADRPCPTPAPMSADDNDKRWLPTRDSLMGVLPDPVPGDLVTGDAAGAPVGCRQKPLAALHAASAVRREYTGGGTADDRLVDVVARFPNQKTARSAEVVLENWMGDCRTAFDLRGQTADVDYEHCRPEPLAVRHGDGVECYWKYRAGAGAPAQGLASAVLRVGDRIVLVDRITPWQGPGPGPIKPVAQTMAAHLPGASEHRPTYQADDIVEAPVRIGSTLAQLDPIKALDLPTWRSKGCLHVPLRPRGTEALVDTASGIVTGYGLGQAGMTPRGVSVYSTLRQAKASYPVGRGYTTDDGRGDVTHGWITTTTDRTEINFNTGPNYAADGHVVGIVNVHSTTPNACRDQAGGGGELE